MTEQTVTSQGAAETIARYKVLPVVVLDDAAQAAGLGEALLAGGLPVAEVTFRTDAAQESIRIMAQNPDLLVGAGTVIREEQVDRAVAAGARFIVSPGFSAAVVARAQEHGVPVFPGVATATEIIAALDAGLDTVKFFPAETSGGLPAVKALAAPFPGLKFIPTGGITQTSMAAYLAHPAVTAVGGSWMVAAGLLREGRFDQVTALAAAAVASTAGVAGNEGKH